MRATFLIKRSGDRLEVGKQTVFLGSDSPLISKFHTNWRLKALDSIDKGKDEDLHFSSVLTCSEKDAGRIREALVKVIEQIRPIIRSSKDEACYSYTIYFFDLG